MVHSRLARRLRAVDLDTSRADLEMLGDAEDEQEALIDPPTTNLTACFREVHHCTSPAQSLSI